MAERKIRFTNLFWETLAEHRERPYYRALRFKTLALLAKKANSIEPLSGADRPFTNPTLKGIWHCKMLQQPEVTLFYAVSNDAVSFAMFGDHRDYGYGGKNRAAEARTADRINNAVARTDAPLPAWPGLRWSDPTEIPNHPDLPELSNEALLALDAELRQEASDGERYRRTYGVDLLATPEPVFDAYLADVETAIERVAALAKDRQRDLHWLNRFLEDSRRVENAGPGEERNLFAIEDIGERRGLGR